MQAKLQLWGDDLLGDMLFRGEDGDVADSECRTTRAQVRFCVAALANAARLEVVPVIIHLASSTK